MGMESVTLHFDVTVTDTEKWDSDSYVDYLFDPHCNDPTDWVVDRLRTRMLAAARQFISENPDLFLGQIENSNGDE